MPISKTRTGMASWGIFRPASSRVSLIAVAKLALSQAQFFSLLHSTAMAGLTATLFVQLASMAGAPAGGWLADVWRRRSPRGRIAVQTIGVLGGAPFVVICGLTQSVATLVVALTLWGFFKGLYDANIFASVFDLVPPEARGRAAGFMNMIGWLAGGGSAPIVIGLIAERASLGAAMALASLVYVAAGALLLAGMLLITRSSRSSTTGFAQS